MTDHAQKLIVALDLPDPARAKELARHLAPLGISFKIGLELFMAGGPALVADMAERYKIFLDLKFHDIPNTVAAAVKSASGLGVWMINVHAAGGRDMLLAAREALESARNRPLFCAVTVLTSMNDTRSAETGHMLKVADQVPILARLAADCGLDGVICSPQEIVAVKEAVSKQFLTVTPGIRPAKDTKGDQYRVATPAAAICAGGDYLVIGRPITAAPQPELAARKILAEMSDAK